MAMNKEVAAVIAKMRARKVNHGKHTSPTLIEWADELESALSASAEPAETPRIDVHTTHEQRFVETIAMLCGGARPPVEMVASWADEAGDDLPLQEFCATHGPWWAQGMAVLDAAQAMAQSPCEGEGHLYATPPASAEPVSIAALLNHEQLSAFASSCGYSNDEAFFTLELLDAAIAGAPPASCNPTTQPASVPMPVMGILDRREVTPLCDHVVMGYTEAQMVAYRDACVAAAPHALREKLRSCEEALAAAEAREAAAGGVPAITESRVELAREAYYNAASVEDGCYTAPDAMRAALAAGGVQGISCPKWRSALRLAFGALEELAAMRVNDSRAIDALEMRKAGNSICNMLAQPIPQQPTAEPAGRDAAIGFARPADLDGVRRNKDSDASIGVFVQPRRTETHSIPLYTTPSPEPAVAAVLQQREALSMIALAEGLRKRGDDLSTDSASWLEKFSAMQQPVTRPEPAVEGATHWEENASYLLDRCKNSIRVREGGGPENLLLSLIATFMGMEQKLAIKPEPAVEATGTIGYLLTSRAVEVTLDDSVPRWMLTNKTRVTISPTGGKSDA